jgi:hypothetical protein
VPFDRRTQVWSLPTLNCIFELIAAALVLAVGVDARAGVVPNARMTPTTAMTALMLTTCR